MSPFMDVHTIEGGVGVDDVARAHEADLAEQGAHDVTYLRYWVDEDAGRIFASSRRRTPRPRTRCTGGPTGSSPSRSSGSPRTAGRGDDGAGPRGARLGRLRAPQRRPWHILNFLPDPQGHGALRGVDAISSSVRVAVPPPLSSRTSTSPVSVGAV